jgi:uncharacterized repeat protein (TIGR02543 family)
MKWDYQNNSQTNSGLRITSKNSVVKWNEFSFWLFKVLLSLYLLFGSIELIDLNGQLTPSEAGFIDAVADYGADNSGKTVTTSQLQDAINAATKHHIPLYIPPGTYLIDATLIVEDDVGDINSHASDEAQNTFICGSSVQAGNRTVILLKSGTFPNLGSKGHVIQMKGIYDEVYTRTYYRMLQNIDIKIEGNNAGAIGLRWRGAEGCSLFDINIDITGGLYGIDMLLGSGGSMAKIAVTGGQYGIYLSNTATQPTPTFTELTLTGQTQSAFFSSSTRGAIVITGGVFNMNPGVEVFEVERHPHIHFSPGGNLILTDCVIEYSSGSSNLAFSMKTGTDQSVHLNDVYVKHVKTLLNVDFNIPANPEGWRYYSEFAYNSGWDINPIGDEPIYIDGRRLTDKVYEEFEDDKIPPLNIQRKHSWGDNFPMFNSFGAINLKDFSNHVDNGDWAPAFNAAIIAAEMNGSNIVFIPVGNYNIYNTIHLRKHTALIGAGHRNSKIFGKDVKNRRFGNSMDPWTDPKPMISTPDDKNADCIIADLSVNIFMPYNNELYSPEPVACYAVLWRAGNHSVIRNIDYRRELVYNDFSGPTNVLTKELSKPEWLTLRSLGSPLSINDLVFKSECKYAYHTSEIVPSRILLETVDSNKRLLTRSLPPARFNSVRNHFDIPNLTITRNNGEKIDLHSFKITNGAWLPNEGAKAFITGKKENKDTTVTVLLNNVSRDSLIEVTLNWYDMDTVLITSSVPFSIDDINTEEITTNFEALTGSELQENIDFNQRCNSYGYMYLPVYYMAHPYVRIEGGCKYYNHWILFATWLRINEPYIHVVENDPDDIVSFYHMHGQHSQNFNKIKIESAHNVSLFGIKSESILEFASVENSENIRIYGYGGITSAPRGAAHFRIENSKDFKVVSPSEEIWTEDDTCINCNWWAGGMLPRTKFGNYDDIQVIDDGDFFSPLQTDSPILYMWGDPHDPWEVDCDSQFLLTVKEGQGTGMFCPGEFVVIKTEIEECEEFLYWTGDTEYLEDSTSVYGIITSMPAMEIELRPVRSDLPRYEVIVNQGTGSGTWCTGERVNILADFPPEGMRFSKWSGDTQFLHDSLSVSTYLIIDSMDIVITANYEDIPRPYTGIPIKLPGTINAELFDNGGEGIAYYDKDPNLFNIFRINEGVDILEKPNKIGDYYLAYCENGEWLEYSISSTLDQSKLYDLYISYAAGGPAGTIRIEIDGIPLGDPITPAHTGSWVNFELHNIFPVKIEPGEHIMRVYFETGGINLDYLEFRELVEYNLNINIDGSGSVTPKGGSYRQNSVIEILATPENGYVFEKWTGDVYSSNNPLTITLDKNISITANFTLQIFIKNILDNPINIYPNPLDEEKLTIETPVPSLITFINISGNIKKQIKCEGKIEIQRSEFDKGIYIIFVNNIKCRLSYKLIVI